VPYLCTMNTLQIVECPRDAMQGFHHYIPTHVKVNYLNTLLRAGFHTLDFGSFVSPKAIPQMRDTTDVLKHLNVSDTSTALLAIVANARGAQEAADFDEIKYLGFPFSISPTFQMRNTNATLDEAFLRVEEIKQICDQNNKELVVYLSMAFGNPYGDEWNANIAATWTRKLCNQLGVKTIALSDTVGVASPQDIEYLFSHLIPEFSRVTIGAHLHTTPGNWEEKVRAAYNAGCRRFDGAIKGFGGCPMAKDDLTGNMPTENLIHFLETKGISHGINYEIFKSAMMMADGVFQDHNADNL